MCVLWVFGGRAVYFKLICASLHLLNRPEKMYNFMGAVVVTDAPSQEFKSVGAL